MVILQLERTIMRYTVVRYTFGAIYTSYAICFAKRKENTIGVSPSIPNSSFLIPHSRSNSIDFYGIK